MRPHEADRVSALLLSVGIGVLLVPLTLALADQWTRYPAYWQLTLLGAVLLSFLLAVRHHPVGSARTLVGTTTIALYTLPFVAAPAPPRPWLSFLVPTAAAAVVLVSAAVWRCIAAHTVMMGGLAWAISQQAWGDAHPERVLGDVLFAYAIAAIGLAFLLAVRESQARLDQAQALAVAEFTQARTADAMIQAANLWDAYVHDEVLAALASISLAPEAPATRAEAARAAGGARGMSDAEVPVPALEVGLVEAVLEILPTADTSFVHTEDARPLPPGVRLALLEATAEALRNVRHHAYAGVPEAPTPASVSLHHDSTGVRLDVRDFGRGFDPRLVDLTRLGISVSIHGRVSAVGGSARLRSRPGTGTLVELRWSAESAR